MKKGFTLAELMITLGVIGVVSALTLPGLINDASSAKVGPSLAKAVAVFDQANKMFLADQEIEALSDSDSVVGQQGLSISVYYQQLSNYMYVEIAGNSMVSEEGFKYTIEAKKTLPTADSSPHLQVVADCIIDINADESPGIIGTDIFKFELMNDGSLRPLGANGEWANKCPVDAVPTEPEYCAGHIFENNFKILYK